MHSLRHASKMIRTSFVSPLPLRLATVSVGRCTCVPRATLSTTAAPEQKESTEEQVEDRPGLLDATRGFKEGRSVQFWRHLDPSVPGSMQLLLKDLRADSMETSRAARYYAYCLGRTLYFSMQGLLGSEIYRAQNRSQGGSSARNINATASLVEAGYVFRNDWDRISQGMYRFPWDASIRHRQNRPLHMLRSARIFARNAVGTLSRRDDPDGADTSVWLDSPTFPDYYRSTFHYQQDGWLSARSADAYEISTETLFIGRQDAMQRLALVGLRSALQVENANPAILEVGAGTGRLATFILDNYPDARYTISDLSAFYLEKARDNIEYWKKFTNRSAQVKYLQAAAENIPVEDESQDIVLASYLYHELPPNARRDALKEAWRVLRPGGEFILVDSVQLGDRFDRDERLDRFERFNEPWYPSYVREDFGTLCAEAGFSAGIKEVSSVTKLLTLKKAAAVREGE